MLFRQGLILAALLTGCATEPVNRPVVLPTGSIVEEVALECKRLVDAWNAGDLGTFASQYAETATFALADGFLVGRPAIRDFYAPNFEAGAVRDELEFEKVDVEVLSPETALVRAVYSNRQRGQVVRRGTTSLTLRRIFGQWQIIHDHST